MKLTTIYRVQDKLEELYLPNTFNLSIYKKIDNTDLVEHTDRAGKIFYQKNRALMIPKTSDQQKKGMSQFNLNCPLDIGYEFPRRKASP